MSTKFSSKKFDVHDDVVYLLNPQHRKWFNKLWFSESLGYNCGPCGVAPHKSGWYVVRPIMNLSGMSVGARKQYIEKDDCTKVEPGYFWCEWFSGPQYSVTYERRDSVWKQQSCWMGTKNENNLSMFTRWSRMEYLSFELPKLFDELLDVSAINVEFIGTRPIEAHLRVSPDPDYDEFIPVWQGQEKTIDKYREMGYSFIKSPDNANGFLKTPRVGFMVKDID